MRLEDQHGYDLLEGVGANRSATASQHAAILYASSSVHPAVDDSDTCYLVIDNHTAPSAEIQVEIYYALGY